MWADARAIGISRAEVMAVAGMDAMEAIEAIGRGSMGFLRIRKRQDHYSRNVRTLEGRERSPANQLRANP